MNTRRTFLRNLSSLAFTAPLMADTPKSKNTVCFFTKHLQGLSFDDIASLGAEAGFNGVEAPIRPKGHIEPEKVVDELPKFVEALKKQGLEMTIITSGINEVSKEQRTEEVLRTAAKLGVKRFRMNYYKYDLKQPIWEQLQAVRPKIKDLVALCKEIGIQPMFQNHSGKDYFGAPVWDIFSIMRDYPAADFSFAFDILHATCEGGLSWPLEFNLVKDHIGAAYFKDFKWDGRKQVTVPLGQGQVDPAYGKMLMKTGYTGPISLHLEYLKGDPKDPAVLKEFREAHVRDMKTLSGWLGWA
ncbi:MAG: sugar phosphate isomerase/epimerase [Prosthecobacter sp.]|uniref:sugar phosphate isomerase/epimerase family protein n=1 Tax=Prosthecobacter sp. TaxID=1965333 RepID=UPI0025D34448|nr:TIM barrel protein [Prosthecobacter sp.]MCF7786639.1 sugar phosphate isomerase/epimerase [Prosthecobacter sp.]